MRISSTIPFLFVLATFASQSGVSHAQNNAIVAGQRIGHLVIGAEMDSATQSLEPTSREDGASGRSKMTWISKGSTPQRLDVVGERDFNATKNVDAFYIRQIRVTSPFFRLSNGIKTGDNLSKIRKYFPDLRALGTSKYAGHKATVYDSASQGIAFEVAGQGEDRRRVISIIVHRKGRRVTQDYMMAAEYFELLP